MVIQNHIAGQCMRMSLKWLPVGMSGSSPPKRSRGLCELRHSEPSGNYRHWEGLLELPMLGAPLNGGEDLRCKFLGLVTKRRQTLNSLLVGAESAENNGSMPSDV